MYLSLGDADKDVDILGDAGIVRDVGIVHDVRPMVHGVLCPKPLVGDVGDWVVREVHLPRRPEDDAGVEDFVDELRAVFEVFCPIGDVA